MIFPSKPHSSSRGGSRAGTVHPDAYARAQDVEDRLIKLIDGGEDLAAWYRGNPMFKGTIRFNLSCPKHRRFNPDKGGRSAVKGGCSHCSALCDVADMARKLRTLVRDVEASNVIQESSQT